VNLIGKVIVVTGAESGIGREIAKTCSAEGATLVLAGLSLSGMEETAAQCGGDHISCCTTDISDEAQVTSLVAHAVQRHGAMHGLVANAGITGPRNALVDIALHDWRSVIDIDLTGTFLTVREAARHMIEQGQGGSIVITGSSTAIRPLSGFLPYIAAKGGLHAMAEALALELGSHRIRVNTLVPGTTATPLTHAMDGYLAKAALALPLGEVTEAAELGRYVAFALSDAVPHMTGSLLKVDSGRTVA